MGWTEALIVSILIGLTMVVAGVVTQKVARQSRDGTLARNRTTGLRTKATMASDGAWDAGQRASADDVDRMATTAYVSAVVPVVVGVILGALGVVGPEGYMAVWAVLLLTGTAILLGFAWRASKLGNAAAKAVLATEGGS